MRILALGVDGADYDLVRELLALGRLPTIARVAGAGAFGPLRSTIPAVTPTAWSSFLTGLNPGAHGIFNFSTNPNRGRQRLESAASRAGTPLWRPLAAAGIRSAFVGIPFTYPAEEFPGLVVTGYGGPERPQILPDEARRRIFDAFPDLVTAHHPAKERWWEDFERYSARLVEHVGEIAGVCRLALELDPELRLLCVDFMSADHAGHLGYARLDPDHPAHDPTAAGDELVRVYEAVDRACGELIDDVERRFGEEPTVLILSDHGMKPVYWYFHANRWLEEHGYLRYRHRSLQPLRRGRLSRLAAVDQRLVRTTRPYGRALDLVPFLPAPGPDRAFADIDFGSTRAYAFATGGQIFLGEVSGARDDPHLADELEQALASVAHPETGRPAFAVLRKEELYHGPYLAKAPELIVLPRDERINVDASRRPWRHAFERLERLDPASFHGYSGHHGVTGIFAASGPGIRASEVPDGTGITQLPATIIRLFGLATEGLDGSPIEAVLAPVGPAVAVAVSEQAQPPSDQPVYSADEERRMVERLRDLGYE